MKILAIDTSCDETSVAISEDDRILANVISSQVELHKKWGGVVPSIAQRAHQEQIDLAIQEALQQAKMTLSDIEVFAVTQGPGLAIALEVGVNKAKALSLEYNKPLVAVNHMVGHLYAALAKNKNGTSTLERFTFPALALLVSGKHTEIVTMNDDLDFTVVGATLDDAMGEAYDKVARMLNLGYPGGPIIAELAEQGNPHAFDFPIPMKHSGDLNFSFSGLKTAVLYTIKKITADGTELDKQQIIDIAASFQRVAFESILIKLKAAAQQYPVKHLILGGGVISNTEFRAAIRQAMKPFGISVYYPDLKKLCTDNAAMIAVAAYYQTKKGQYADPNTLDRDPSLSLTHIQ
jgi:N6-L-threonylcarbamoyladenine synthase